MTERWHGVRQVGFTLIEILMVLALLGVMLAAGMPGFMTFITKARVSGTANELLGDLSYARSEAATRQVEVAMCVTTDQASCTSGNAWQRGRIIFIDTNADGAVSAGETVLRVSQATTATTVVASGFGSTDIVRFRPYGGLRPPTQGLFRVCPSSGSEGRQLSVATTGRPIISKINNCP